MHPNFLEVQLEKSLDNLGLQTLDLYYLQMASEFQLFDLYKKFFYDKLAKCFEFFERKILEKKIKNYGLATFLCFRSNFEEFYSYLSLTEIIKLAKKVGGPNHGLKFIQVPVNIHCNETFSEKGQIIGEGENTKNVTFFTAARLNRVNVITSQPLLKGTLLNVDLPTKLLKCENQSARHLQIIRSIPSETLISKFFIFFYLYSIF